MLRHLDVLKSLKDKIGFSKRTSILTLGLILILIILVSLINYRNSLAVAKECGRVADKSASVYAHAKNDDDFMKAYKLLKDKQATCNYNRHFLAIKPGKSVSQKINYFNFYYSKAKLGYGFKEPGYQNDIKQALKIVSEIPASARHNQSFASKTTLLKEMSRVE